MADVAWVGQDGNLWYKGQSGVQNWGSANNYQFTDGGIRASNFDTPLGQGAGFAPGVSIIDDPVNPPKNTAPVQTPTSTAKSLDEAAVRNTQLTIDQLPGILQAALASEKQNYDNTISAFGQQERQQRSTYDDSSVTNQKNYDSNFMDSIRAGIKGFGGLMSLLRGTGGSGGTAEGMARDAVGSVTANDIRTGADTRDENQTALDVALSSFLTDLKGKRQQNEDTYTNNTRSIQRESDTQLQDLFGKMAGYYGDAERTADANSWMDRAGQLTPKIAANSATKVSAYDTSPIKVKAPQISAFSDPSQPNIVTSPNGEIGAGIFSMGDTRRRRDTSVGV